MGTSWISWSATVTVIITLLQIQGLMSITTQTVTCLEGDSLSFRCDYPQDRKSNVKYFYKADDDVADNHQIQTDKHNQSERNGRFSLYDNTTAACVIIRVDKVTQEDSGTYWCGVDVSSYPDIITVIQLRVQVNIWTTSTTEPPFIRVNKPLFLTAVMCVAAMLFVCLFTLCLLLTVRYKQSVPRHNRQTSADYETMMPGVRNDPEHCCSCPDCTELPAFSPPPPDLCSKFKPKQRESTVSISICEYVDVDAPGHICQYQSLNVSQTEDRVYHDLCRNHVPKNERIVGVKEQMNC